MSSLPYILLLSIFSWFIKCAGSYIVSNNCTNYIDNNCYSSIENALNNYTLNQSTPFDILFIAISTIHIESVTITNLETRWVFSNSATVHLQDCIFSTSNITFTVLDNAEITFTNCQLINNNIIDTINPSIFQLHHSSQLIINNSIISYHHLPTGSFIQTNNGDISIQILNTSIYKNKFDSQGLILSDTDRIYINIDKCTIHENEGYILNSKSFSPINNSIIIDIVSSIFVNNTLTSNGAIIDVIYNDIQIESSIFDKSSSDVDILNSIFSNCVSDYCVSFILNTNYFNMDKCFGFISSNVTNTANGLYIQFNNNHIDPCVNISGNSFGESNENSIYINLDNGDHTLLQDTEFLSMFCDSDCSNIHSSLTYLCIAVDLFEANQCAENITTKSETILYSFPGEVETLYIYAFDAFGNKIKSNHFNIFVDSLFNNTYIPSNTGAVSWRNKYEQIVSFTVLPKKTTGAITIYDKHNIITPLYMNITVKDCQSNQHKKSDPVIKQIYECVSCPIDSYTIDNGECVSCHDLEGITCNGGINIVLNRNWYAKIEYNINESYLATQSCAPGYCCRDRDGCPFDQKNILCGLNRDHDFRMCGKCKPGFHETLSSVGNCGKCDTIELGILSYTLGCFCLLYLLYYFTKKERKVSHPLNTYFCRSLLFFYQIYGFVTFRSFIYSLHIFTEAINFIFNFSETGTCFFKNLEPLAKIYTTMLVPLILIFDLGLLFIYIYIRYHKNNKAFLNHMIAFYTVCDYILRIIYVELMYSFCRIFACIEYDNEWYMLYAPNEYCANWRWYLFAMLIPLFIFGAPACWYYVLRSNYLNKMSQS